MSYNAGYQQQGYPQQGYPQQSYPQQGYPQQQQYGQQHQGYPQAPSSTYAPGQYTPEKQQYQQQQHQPQQQMHVQQPSATNPMSISGAGGARNAKNLPVGPDGREWSHGLCDCCDDAGTCFLAWCCPCVVYAQNKHRHEHLQAKGYPDPEHGGGCCTGDCWLHGCLTGCLGVGFILQFMQRGNYRGRYNIAGGGCGDCCVHCWCTPCALTQESLEIGLEEQTLGGK